MQPNSRPAFAYLREAFDSFETGVVPSQYVPIDQVAGAGAGAGAGPRRFSEQQLKQMRDEQERMRLLAQGLDQMHVRRPLPPTPQRVRDDPKAQNERLGLVKQQPQAYQNVPIPKVAGLTQRPVDGKVHQLAEAANVIVNAKQLLRTPSSQGARSGEYGTGARNKPPLQPQAATFVSTAAGGGAHVNIGPNPPPVAPRPKPQKH